ncbi:hypothetical protein Phi4:1_gp136 [Cellulophaga phage phi4:1]|uniref:Uncharacterized protein n=3 Tax=Lightbulbvirus Cba41 TaxID=1918524 RepID=A0A0S2MWQ1_9CAUD|nr:hypothetical protein Phi4:1_gp136 [Cellulophaga phage phi4:1]AGO49549.1 hypothetical protein Phi4:1_gp136 [Cellulophaga phage phi4:1]ALO80145.1 hypothetical protein Phi4113_136 [Cellulophaga phage phi4:1_13]ALO80342.1 hypothetical protein Phi4118_136 [Cellulophaga phage phi4:1_18]
MVRKYRSKEELKSYFGRTLFFVMTTLKEGYITTVINTREVYNPLDFKRLHRSTPCEGCDIVIGHNSTNSDYIYDINKEANHNIGSFSLHRYNEINYFNYCEENQVEEVKAMYLEAIKKDVSGLILELKEEISTLEKIVIN